MGAKLKNPLVNDGVKKSKSTEPVVYKPKTPLGRKLLEIRQRIVASGEPLLSLDELEREIAERRGEISKEE